MNTLLKLTVTGIATSFMLLSCQNENLDDQSANNTTIPTEVAEQLYNLGFDPLNAERKENPTSDGEIAQNGWLVAGDIFITDTDIDNLINTKQELDDDSENRAYRRRSIINTNRNRRNGQRIVRVRFAKENSSTTGRPVRPSGLANRSLRAAINRLNGQNLKMRFQIVGQNASADITVSAKKGSLDGRAGFPVNGNFSSSFVVATAPDQRRLTALLTHELMHAMGFRHSDFRTRSSCRRAGRPNQAFAENNNARHIPGTSRNRNNLNSIMTACYIGKAGLTGEDKKALRRLYGR